MIKTNSNIIRYDAIIINVNSYDYQWSEVASFDVNVIKKPGRYSYRYFHWNCIVLLKMLRQKVSHHFYATLIIYVQCHWIQRLPTTRPSHTTDQKIINKTIFFFSNRFFKNLNRKEMITGVDPGECLGVHPPTQNWKSLY